MHRSTQHRERIQATTHQFTEVLFPIEGLYSSKMVGPLLEYVSRGRVLPLTPSSELVKLLHILRDGGGEWSWMIWVNASPARMGKPENPPHDSVMGWVDPNERFMCQSRSRTPKTLG